jgi:hypothetical protein
MRIWVCPCGTLSSSGGTVRVVVLTVAGVVGVGTVDEPADVTGDDVTDDDVTDDDVTVDDVTVDDAPSSPPQLVVTTISAPSATAEHRCEMCARERIRPVGDVGDLFTRAP